MPSFCAFHPIWVFEEGGGGGGGGSQGDGAQPAIFHLPQPRGGGSEKNINPAGEFQPSGGETGVTVAQFPVYGPDHCWGEKIHLVLNTQLKAPERLRHWRSRWTVHSTGRGTLPELRSLEPQFRGPLISAVRSCFFFFQSVLPK